MKRSPIIFALFFTFAACKQSAPKMPMTEEVFQQVYAEAFLIYAQSDSATRRTRIDSLLKAWQITMQDLQCMVDQFNQTPQVWVDFYKGVDQSLQEMSIKKDTLFNKITQKDSTLHKQK